MEGILSVVLCLKVDTQGLKDKIGHVKVICVCLTLGDPLKYPSASLGSLCFIFVVEYE